MAQITIEVSEQKLEKVMNILNSMKPELIQNISCEKAAITPIPKPVKSSLDKIEAKASQGNNPNKYLSKQAYQQKKQAVLEDEFLAGKQSSSKYVSPQEYKQRLKK